MIWAETKSQRLNRLPRCSSTQAPRWGFFVFKQLWSPKLRGFKEQRGWPRSLCPQAAAKLCGVFRETVKKGAGGPWGRNCKHTSPYFQDSGGPIAFYPRPPNKNRKQGSMIFRWGIFFNWKICSYYMLPSVISTHSLSFGKGSLGSCWICFKTIGWVY